MRYPKEVSEYIYQNYKGTGHKAMSNAIYEKFGFKMSHRNVKNFYANHGLHSGLDGRFVKGQKSYNKGLKQTDYMTPEGIERSKPTRFQKGQTPANHKPVGSERVNVEGYIEIKVAEPRTWKLKNRVVWEQVNGPIPKGKMVIFLDKNKLNCSIDNLELIDRSTHALMCHKGLYSESPELTRAGIAYCQLSRTIHQKTNRKEQKND